MIPARPFGATGLEVSALGMGCAALGAFWQGRSLALGRRALQEAVDQGITFFDTADMYARGISERLVGAVARSSSQDLVLCTKVGSLKTPVAAAAAQRSGCGPGRSATGWLQTLQGMARESVPAQCFTSAYVERAAERSLRRLGSDHVDVLLLHSPAREVIERGAFFDGAARLRQQGKVRHFGISCADPQAAAAALATPGVDCLELPCNPRVQGAYAAVLGEAARRGIGVVARSVFDTGALLSPAAGGDTVAQACLQFALRTPGVSVVLAGMSRPEHVRSNVALVGAAPLPGEELDRILATLGGDPGVTRC